MPPPLCHCPQPHVPDTELHPPASLLKKCAYDEYRRYKLGEGPNAIAEYVNLAVLEKLPPAGGSWRGRGRGWMRISERVGWSMWLRKQGYVRYMETLSPITALKTQHQSLCL